VCILLVGNDDDEDRGELGGVDQFGVTEVSEKATLRELSGLKIPGTRASLCRCQSREAQHKLHMDG
jgi:hypothetical protein